VETLAVETLLEEAGAIRAVAKTEIESFRGGLTGVRMRLKVASDALPEGIKIGAESGE
jgi:hypothetical protein